MIGRISYIQLHTEYLNLDVGRAFMTGLRQGARSLDFLAPLWTAHGRLKVSGCDRLEIGMYQSSYYRRAPSCFSPSACSDLGLARFPHADQLRAFV